MRERIQVDDLIVFAKTRWQLRRVIKNMHELVHGLKLKLALDKTFIGRIQKSFDFWNKRLQFDEQSAPDQRVQATIASWHRWARAGISPAAVGGL